MSPTCISGVIGQRGQAKYTAANVFLDSFAAYRRQRSQAASSVELGRSTLIAATPMVTGIIAPQLADWALLQDARFAALRTRSAGGRAVKGGNSANADVQALLLLLKSKSAEASAHVAATVRSFLSVDVVNKCFVRMPRLSEPMNPARPLPFYGIGSLAAVEGAIGYGTNWGAWVP
ncbi:hypothetical protein CcaCcLH18_06078 [Colletotrichum camelliae]|nr:hypothetical protein CcaCcLH18_06078 [Colletotrichum camelliae]